MKIKILAFYLPQYHSIPENDMWWGKGFTEWTNVKKAKPLFKWQYQPEEPLNGYYDLSNTNVLEQQAKMAKKYGIYGFCYYHYWFNGKLLLQKPLENMLNNNAVQIPSCLCWANETWSRRWDGRDNQILIKQNYEDDIEGWKAHFNYLLNYFKDNRYIKVDNKPMIIIYKPYLFKNINIMINYWEKLAKENGFSGLYIGYQHHTCFENTDLLTDFNFGIEFEPFFTVNEKKKEKSKVVNLLDKAYHTLFKTPYIYDYDETCKEIIKRKHNEKVYVGAFASWDNTPRVANRANIFKGSNPEKFEKYFRKQYFSARENNSDFLFINAWNEWAEGAHLEPDKLNNYGYLEAVRKIINEAEE